MCEFKPMFEGVILGQKMEKIVGNNVFYILFMYTYTTKSKKYIQNNNIVSVESN